MTRKLKHPNLPPDPTEEEYQIVETVIANIYSKLDDPIDKFIVAFCFELNYTQSLAADALGGIIPQSQVPKRVAKIKKILFSSYGANLTGK